MDHITHVNDIPEAARNGILVIGNFDGLHRGHQALLARARAAADTAQKPLCVLTFSPHPRSLFRPDDPPFRLTDDTIKREWLERSQVDFLITLTFDWDFASQTAEQFIDRVLKAALVPAEIIVGADFHFGQLRKGTVDTLRAAGLAVTVQDKIADATGVLSSSAVRQALRAGNLARARMILGRDWELRGTVQSGDRRGRELGYPTANVPMGDYLHPAYGVYATWVRIEEDGPDAPWMMAATNIGIRPMFALRVGQVEAHILDFDRDIYGKTLRLRLVDRLRGEAKFESLEALIAQIGQDCAITRKILSREHVYVK
jgi:riboflavin kinase/FMN adenylyltransferase